MLSAQYGIRVIWSPGRCETNGKTIYLPTLPDDAPDALLEAVQGYVDHETAHIIFTDFDAAKKRNPPLTDEQFFCANAVEDVRIEAAISNLFPGSPYNLRKAHEWIYLQIGENWGKLNQFRRVCAAYFDYVKYGESEFWSEYVDFKTFELVKKCVDAVGPHSKINSTNDAIDAGLRMYEVLKEFAEEEKKQREERQKNKTSNGQGDEDAPVSSLGDIGKVLTKVAKDIGIAAASGKPNTRLPGGITYTHDLDHDSTYMIYDTARDTYIHFPAGEKNAGKLARLREEARDLTSVMRTRLVNSLRASARRRWVGGKEEGRIDSRRLHRAVLGLGDDVFKQRTNKMALNTAVALAIDHSGSMAGRKLELAGESALVIGDALNTLRVPFMVYGYSTEGNIYTVPDARQYARWNALWIRFYREFDEPWEQGALRLAGAKDYAQENTLDAESIKYGIRRLLARPEKRKVLFVFNDGMPYPGFGHQGRCQQHLRDVIASAASVGVELVAFGIQDSNVKEYYPNYVVINNLTDLVKEPLQIIDSMLRKGVTLR